MVTKEAKQSKQESVSSESESEEEAEYHPNVSLSVSHTQIPEEKEEEEELEQKEEDKRPGKLVLVTDTPDSLPAEVGQPAGEPSQEKEESSKVTETETNAEEEKDEGRETEESTDDPMVTPDEAPDGLVLPVATGVMVTAEEEEEPKVNGEAPLVEVEPRPQVICCSEVKSWLGRLQSSPRVSSLLPAVETPYFSSCCWFPSCLREYLSPMYILTLIWSVKSSLN